MSDNSRKWTHEHEAFAEATREMLEIETLAANILRRLDQAATVRTILESQFSQGPPFFGPSDRNHNYFQVPEGPPPPLLQVAQRVIQTLFQILSMLERPHLLDNLQPQGAETPRQGHGLAPLCWGNPLLDAISAQHHGSPHSAASMVQPPQMPLVHARPLHQYQYEQAPRMPCGRSLSWQNLRQAHYEPSQGVASQFGFDEYSRHQKPELALQIRSPCLLSPPLVTFPFESCILCGAHQQQRTETQMLHSHLNSLTSQDVAFRSKPRTETQSQYNTSQNATSLSECYETVRQHQPLGAHLKQRGRPASMDSIRARERPPRVIESQPESDAYELQQTPRETAVWRDFLESQYAALNKQQHQPTEALPMSLERLALSDSITTLQLRPSPSHFPRDAYEQHQQQVAETQQTQPSTPACAGLCQTQYQLVSEDVASGSEPSAKSQMQYQTSQDVASMSELSANMQAQNQASQDVEYSLSKPSAEPQTQDQVSHDVASEPEPSADPQSQDLASQDVPTPSEPSAKPQMQYQTSQDVVSISEQNANPQAQNQISQDVEYFQSTPSAEPQTHDQVSHDVASQPEPSADPQTQDLASQDVPSPSEPTANTPQHQASQSVATRPERSPKPRIPFGTIAWKDLFASQSDAQKE